MFAVATPFIFPIFADATPMVLCPNPLAAAPVSNSIKGLSDVVGALTEIPSNALVQEALVVTL